MNLFELFIKIGVDDQASRQLADISGKLGNGLKTAAKVGVAAVGAAVTGIAALTTAAVKNYAQYEQLVGGVETLFKDSADTVLKYAEGAYASAGLSANQYMETVTSFSASLLQSLGGDTEAAAEKANVAITDMADNAAKMGSSIETLQTAYAGFARGQFMLLDNLKLGYGGTQEEMQRLLEDAQAISGIEYDISSYADIVDALHVIQTEMGITGTTAREASTTIQGSLSMVKSAWANLTVAIADENSDIKGNVDDFASSVGTFFDNILPRVETSMDGVLQFVEAIIPKIMEQIPTLVSNFLPKLITSGVNILKSLATGIKNNAKIIVSAGKDAVLALIDGLPDLLPDVIDAGIELLSGVVEAIPEVAIKVAQNIPKIVDSVVNGLVAGTVRVVKAAVGLFVPIADESEEAKNRLLATLDATDSFTQRTQEFAQSQVDLSDALSDSGRKISDIDDAISTAEGEIYNILSTALSDQQGLRNTDLENIRNYNQQIRELENEKLSIYQDQQLAELRRAQLDLAETDVAGLGEITGKAEAALKASNDAVEQMYANRLISVENQYKAMGAIGTAEYEAALMEAKAIRDADLAENQSYYDQTIAMVGQRSSELVGINLSAFTQLATYNDTLNTYYDKFSFGNIDLREFHDKNDTILRELSAVDRGVATYTDALNDLDIAAANAFLTTQVTLIESGRAIDEESLKVAQTILSAFSDLPGEMGENGKTVLLELVSGMESQIPELKRASEMSVDEIKGAIEGYLSASNGESVAGDFVSGIYNGITIELPSVRDKINSIMSGITSGSAYTTPFSIDGSHANGLGYVPYDGYIAELHRGERVLTADEARSYNNSFSYGDVHITVNGANYDSEQSIAEAIAERLQYMTERRSAVYA